MRWERRRAPALAVPGGAPACTQLLVPGLPLGRRPRPSEQNPARPCLPWGTAQVLGGHLSHTDFPAE